MDFVNIGVGALIGLGLGGVIFAILLTVKLRDLAASEANVISQNDRINQLIDELNKKRDELEASKESIATLNETVRQERSQSVTQLKLLADAKDSLTLQFKNLANEIFEEKGKKFTDKNSENLSNILTPFQTRIDDFKKTVMETYNNEVKERIELKVELARLTEMNENLSKGAERLTNALVKQSHTQGAWGEMILETVLEKSGLIEGVHYRSQYQAKNEDGHKLIPDVIINLPEGKHIIVDSKVSLTAYQKYCSETKEDIKGGHLKDHLNAVRARVKELSDKKYYNLFGLKSLEFVLMFMPIEGAFSVASHKDLDLVDNALKNNVIIVTPTTLLLALKTIGNVWRNEARSKNAELIASKAGQLYDKFVGFVSDVEIIGSHINKAHESQESALNKLSTGKGNLINRANDLKELGAKTNKILPESVMKRLEENVTSE